MGRIIAEVSDRVATAIISAPPMNALDAAMRAELAARIQEFEQDDTVRAIVLRGDGLKTFAPVSISRSFQRIWVRKIAR